MRAAADSDDLERRAARLGVATSYVDQQGRRVDIAPEDIRAVLEALGDVPDAERPAAPRPTPTPLAAGPRAWGWSVQLYAVPSRDSWGIGDLRDLRTLVEWTGAHGGGLVLVNPLHAAAPGLPMQPSPYFPCSRRFTNPVYLRVEDTSEYAEATPELRARVDALRVDLVGDLVDRDASWSAKQAALELLVPQEVEIADEVRDFATWCALAEVHGNDWREWDDELRRPDSPAVAVARDELIDRVRFHAWLQQLCEHQLAAVDDAARRAGMAVGVVHDLAVGTDPGGADAWMLQDALALAAHIGAPPDPFNQQGQDWGLPPWNPAGLAAAGYRPLRDLVAVTLRHAGGIRIDHVLGMFRAWWVPVDRGPKRGSYVRYDTDAMLGAVVDAARQADAIVVGEDLGTVTPDMRTTLTAHGILGTSVLWFEREQSPDGKAAGLRPLADWREAAMASVTTHDLPTALGWLRGEHVRVRADAGLLDDPDADAAAWRRERAELLDRLVTDGVIDDVDVPDVELAHALHIAVARTPSRYVVAALGDAVGDLRQPNLPATTDAYPNWRLAVTDSDGRVMRLDDLLSDARVDRLAADLTRAVAAPVR